VKEYKNATNLDSDEEKIVKLNKLKEQEKKINKEIKDTEIKLKKESIKCIENLTESEIDNLLYIKWIKSLIDNLNKLPDEVLSEFTKSIENATKKYDTTLVDLDKEINETEKELSNMIDNLTGDEFDMKGLEEFKTLLGGE
jgi:type I restriction enzyme M protein